MNTSADRQLKRAKSRSGAILGVVMVVLVLLSMIGMGLVNLGTSDGIETVRSTQRAQAFWLAEAGLQEAIGRLATNGIFRDSIAMGYPGTFTGNLSANSSFQCTVSRIASNMFQIASAGRQLGVARSVGQTVKVDPESYFPSNAITARALDVNNKVTISGEVSCFATNATPSSATNGMTFKSPPDIPPPLDTTEYDTAVTDAAANPNTNNTVTSLILKHGDTVKVSGNLNNLGSLTSTNGTGTLVVSGNVTIVNPGFIGSNVTLIVGGTLEFRNGATVGTNCLVYAGYRGPVLPNSIYFKQGTVFSNNCVLLTPGNIVADQSFIFNGFMYAGTTIWLKNNSTIVGAMISGGLGDLDTQVDLNAHVTVIYDPSQLITTVYGLGVVHVQRLGWQEL